MLLAEACFFVFDVVAVYALLILVQATWGTRQSPIVNDSDSIGDGLEKGASDIETGRPKLEKEASHEADPPAFGSLSRDGQPFVVYERSKRIVTEEHKEALAEGRRKRSDRSKDVLRKKRSNMEIARAARGAMGRVPKEDQKEEPEKKFPRRSKRIAKAANTTNIFVDAIDKIIDLVTPPRKGNSGSDDGGGDVACSY